MQATVPDYWAVRESLTLVAPDGQANVIFSSESLDEDIGLDEYVRTQGVLIRDKFPGYREFSLDPIVLFGGFPGSLRHFEWSPPDELPVAQLQAYVVRSGRGYTATTTARVLDFPQREEWLRWVLAHLSISADGVGGRA